MNKGYIKLLNETFENLQEINPEKVKELVLEMKKVFFEIQEKIASKDPEQYKQAEEIALQMKDVLEVQMHAMLEKSGMSLEDLRRIAQDPSSLGEKEQSLLKELREEFMELAPVEETAKKAKKVRKPISYIAG